MAPFIMMWIHLLAVFAWIGGMMFSLLVVKPAFSGKQSAAVNHQLLIRIETRFRTVRWVSIITILLTGFFNLLYEGGSERIESEWGAILMVKLLIVAIAMGMTGIHDFILNASPLDGKKTISSGRYAWITHIVLLLNVVVVFVAVYLGLS